MGLEREEEMERKQMERKRGERVERVTAQFVLWGDLKLVFVSPPDGCAFGLGLGWGWGWDWGLGWGRICCGCRVILPCTRIRASRYGKGYYMH
eukprot:1341505-Amorphochlora_amoeboformis.AAC.1